MLVLSAVLGYVAGFSGLVNLVGKTWVSLIALAAGISTTGVILALTTLKYSDHLRAAAEYELLYRVPYESRKEHRKVSSVSRSCGKPRTGS